MESEAKVVEKRSQTGRVLQRGISTAFGNCVFFMNGKQASETAQQKKRQQKLCFGKRPVEIWPVNDPLPAVKKASFERLAASFGLKTDVTYPN